MDETQQAFLKQKFEEMLDMFSKIDKKFPEWNIYGASNENAVRATVLHDLIFGSERLQGILKVINDNVAGKEIFTARKCNI